MPAYKHAKSHINRVSYLPLFSYAHLLFTFDTTAQFKYNLNN